MSLIFLLFGIVAVIKMISFSSYDKIYDLLWLIVLGSIAIRGLRPSFQKKEAENKGLADKKKDLESSEFRIHYCRSNTDFLFHVWRSCDLQK